MSCCGSSNQCVDEFGCPESGSGVCPDFTIKRFDTLPSFEIIIKNCGEPVDLTDSIVEVSMWANAKLKSAITTDDVYFGLADNIGFQQSLVGDIMVIGDRVRAPEQMLITGFDEQNSLIRVQRGYNGSNVFSYKKGAKLKIFRFINSIGSTESVYKDLLQLDGTTEEDVLTESRLIYDWSAQDTCVPGCFYVEFKLLKMTTVPGFAMSLTSPSIVPSFTSISAAEMGCVLGSGVESVRRFPIDKEGYLVKVINTPNSEIISP